MPVHLTPQTAAACLRAVRPDAYAASRNHLEGAATGLSPFITHGLLSIKEVLQAHPVPMSHRLSMELGWRAFFQLRWRHLGEAIFSSLHAGPLPDSAYAAELPPDVREGRSGVPAIDAAVRQLYATGLLHNHARLWLASYLVHQRKLHWRVGADWLYGHLLDGDLASNALSWQWVAGTGSHKPYLFNADNVARFAPPAWHSPGTAIDSDYATLDERARTPKGVGPEPSQPAAMQEPALDVDTPRQLGGMPQPERVRGELIWIVHPWALAEPPPGHRALLLIDPTFHARWPWRRQRWATVAVRLRELCPDPADRWCVTAAEVPNLLRGTASVGGLDNLHLDRSMAAQLGLQEPKLPWAEPGKAAHSFSAYWKACSGGSQPPLSGGRRPGS